MRGQSTGSNCEDRTGDRIGGSDYGGRTGGIGLEGGRTRLGGRIGGVGLGTSDWRGRTGGFGLEGSD